MIKDNFVYIIGIAALVIFGSVMLAFKYDTGLISTAIAGIIAIAGYAKTRNNN